MTAPTGRSFTLSVDSTATIADLKAFFVQHYPDGLKAVNVLISLTSSFG
jgi:hypothetical protein